MTLKDVVASDMVALLASSDFGETVTYTDAGSVSGDSIPALIFREEPDSDPDTGHSAAFQKALVVIRNSSTATLGRPHPSEAGDTITLTLRIGDASTTVCRVVDVISGDHGAWLLEVRA